MTLQNILETFETESSASVALSGQPDPKELEAIRAEAFESGYSSGWEDAQKADGAARERVEAEFERNIQNLIFTYSEAVDCVRGELKSFLSAIINGFLPEIVPDLTREHVRNELLKLADDLVEAPVEIVCSPDSKALLEELLHSNAALEIRLIEDGSLAARQVYIRIAEREIEVNVTPLIEALRVQLRAVAEDVTERTSHG
jgi:flagellar assembly protein FliH